MCVCEAYLSTCSPALTACSFDTSSQCFVGVFMHHGGQQNSRMGQSDDIHVCVKM